MPDIRKTLQSSLQDFAALTEEDCSELSEELAKIGLIQNMPHSIVFWTIVSQCPGLYRSRARLKDKASLAGKLVIYADGLLARK